MHRTLQVLESARKLAGERAAIEALSASGSSPAGSGHISGHVQPETRPGRNMGLWGWITAGTLALVIILLLTIWPSGDRILPADVPRTRLTDGRIAAALDRCEILPQRNAIVIGQPAR